MMYKIRFFLKQIFLAFLYLSRIKEYRRPKLDYGKYKGKKAMVMGNGPSLKLLFDKYHRNEIEISPDSFFVNFASLDDTFYEIKPKHYFLSDYGFSRESDSRADEIKKMYKRLQDKVDWELNIYVARLSKKECQQLVAYSKITNPHIHFVFLYKRCCEDFSPSLRNRLYKSGYFMPLESTIVNTALWVAILEGYSEIDLYGVETNQFKDLSVSDDNKAYIVDRHFYGQEVGRLVGDSNGQHIRIHVFLNTICGMLKSHYILSQFAEYMGVKVYNCTPDSMIDSYERKKTIV